MKNPISQNRVLNVAKPCDVKKLSQQFLNEQEAHSHSKNADVRICKKDFFYEGKIVFAYQGIFKKVPHNFFEKTFKEGGFHQWVMQL